jgi:hypothetical protein
LNREFQEILGSPLRDEQREVAVVGGVGLETAVPGVRTTSASQGAASCLSVEDIIARAAVQQVGIVSTPEEIVSWTSD